MKYLLLTIISGFLIPTLSIDFNKTSIRVVEIYFTITIVFQQK